MTAFYFVLAFLLSWLPWPLILLNPASSPMVPFGPLLAAAIVAALTHTSRQLYAQLDRWRAPARWYLAAVLVPLAVLGLAAALAVAAGASPVAAVTARPDWVQVAAAFGSTVVLVGLFEEVGWRGFALPRLQQRMTRLPAALLLGAVWAVWHLPLLVSEPTRQRPVVQFLILVVAQAVFLSRLYNASTAGLPLVILSHAVIDTSAQFVLPLFAGSGYQLVWWALAGLWTVVAGLGEFLPSERFRAHPGPVLQRKGVPSPAREVGP